MTQESGEVLGIPRTHYDALIAERDGLLRQVSDLSDTVMHQNEALNRFERDRFEAIRDRDTALLSGQPRSPQALMLSAVECFLASQSADSFITPAGPPGRFIACGSAEFLRDYGQFHMDNDDAPAPATEPSVVDDSVSQAAMLSLLPVKPEVKCKFCDDTGWVSLSEHCTQCRG